MRTLLNPGTSVIPNRAGAKRGVYDHARFMYNATAATLRPFRDVVGMAKAGGLVQVSLVGDSKVAGLQPNATPPLTAAYSWPARLGSILQSRGVPIGGTGWVFASQGADTDTRWTRGTGWTGGSTNVAFASCSTAGSSLTFTSDVAGTIVEILTLGTSAAFQYQVDGGAFTTYTPPGSSTYQTVSVTGLSNVTHTVTIQPTTSSSTYIVAVRVRGTTGLLLNNHGVVGSTAYDWTTSSAYYQSYNTLAAVTASCTIISLGINDMRNNRTDYYANMTTLINREMNTLGRGVALVVPTPAAVADSSYARWTPFYTTMYQLADDFNIPLIDLTDQFGTWEISNAAGKQNDSLHENTLGYAVDAETIVGLFQV